jgi:nucleotide-binding universal stress UspA family protein
VMGLRRHHRVDRVTHDETTLNVMRGASCPVLGVTTLLTARPRCAVVGVDFGAASTRAVRVALDVLDDGGTLVLAHVEPPGRDPDLARDDAGDTAGGDVVYALGVEAAFDRLVTDLVVPADVTVTRVRVAGEAGRHVSEALFAVAEEHRADLIAVASRRHDWLDRALLGSVTTELAREGRHSLLVVPPPPATRPVPLDVMASGIHD